MQLDNQGAESLSHEIHVKRKRTETKIQESGRSAEKNALSNEASRSNA
jgi:hypothetical protein